MPTLSTTDAILTYRTSARESASGSGYAFRAVAEGNGLLNRRAPLDVTPCKTSKDRLNTGDSLALVSPAVYR